MPLHVGKGRNISTAISDIIDYVENPQKTDFGKFIYGYECDTRLADAEFLLSKRQYANLTGRNQGADDVIAYHLRQAFKPGEVTPEEANQIGRELALKLTKGNHAFVVCTHVDKHHVHNHIIINSTTLDCQKKFRNFWGSTWAIRRMNDKLCLEHGLSIVENPKPSREHYGTWLGNKKQPSFQEQIRIAIAKPGTAKNSEQHMRLKFCCTRRQRIILTSWESKSSPLSNLSGRNTPTFWNKNGKPILPISRPKMI